MPLLLFAISFKCSQTRKKVVINSFCSFLFLNYGKKKSDELRVTGLMPEASLRLFKNELLFSRTTIAKIIFQLKSWFYNHFLNAQLEFFF